MLQGEFERYFEEGAPSDKFDNNTIFLIDGQIVQF